MRVHITLLPTPPTCHEAGNPFCAGCSHRPPTDASPFQLPAENNPFYVGRGHPPKIISPAWLPTLASRAENNPFYAGFGNRDTDEVSYLAVGIPPSKIFIINPKGEEMALPFWLFNQPSHGGPAQQDLHHPPQE